MLRMPPLPHWSSGRTVLVGDSAHAPTSSSGQGASLALESALELTRCLRDILNLDTAFAAYESLRRARVEAIGAMAATANRNKAGQPDSTPAERFDPTHHHIDFDATVTPGSSDPADFEHPKSGSDRNAQAEG
jgi:2-polyprenyl-6-methoxyphenol hydroxylase-like FAD-dependent oxidoreductase